MAGRNLIFSHLNGCTDSYSAFFKFEIRNSNLKYPPYLSTRRNSYVVYVLFRHVHEDAKIPPRGLNRLEHRVKMTWTSPQRHCHFGSF